LKWTEEEEPPSEKAYLRMFRSRSEEEVIAVMAGEKEGALSWRCGKGDRSWRYSGSLPVFEGKRLLQPSERCIL
jgi:hypothetical protein